MDWDTISDVKGSPEIKALFYTEYKREGGHPDFVYWRTKFESLDLEEKTRNELIKQSMDRINNPEKYRTEPPKEENEADKKRRIDFFIREESESNEPEQVNLRQETVTTGNKYGNRFVVPKEVYSNETYREYLNYAKSMESVRVIVDEYYRKYAMGEIKEHPKKTKPEETQEPVKQVEEPRKKKHWWQ